jgi:hypothetical protein
MRRPLKGCSILRSHLKNPITERKQGNSEVDKARKFSLFQVRWAEPLGKPECPYMYRWAIVLFGFSIRLHHWIRSDDKRYFHDHPWGFVLLVLRGGYTDVSPTGEDLVRAGSVRFRSAFHRHYVSVPKGGAWTLLLCCPAFRNWGFWVDGKFKRPLKFFSKYGHSPCDEQ